MSMDTMIKGKVLEQKSFLRMLEFIVHKVAPFSIIIVCLRIFKNVYDKKNVSLALGVNVKLGNK